MSEMRSLQFVSEKYIKWKSQSILWDDEMLEMIKHFNWLSKSHLYKKQCRNVENYDILSKRCIQQTMPYCRYLCDPSEDIWMAGKCEWL